YESSSAVLYNEELSWAYHYFSYVKDEIQVLFLRRFITPMGILGSQELRYSILEWTGNSMVLNHVSHDGDLTHKMTLIRAALDVDHMQPGLLSLKANYPNPFNPVTTITVESENESFGDLSIFNLQGQWVRTLYSGSFHPGQSTYRWHGIDHRGNPVSSGTYLYRLRVNGRVISRKMVLFK
ncbi:MAG TPA: T9SS type A sorting domain-containing protein, partial [Candidatus Marinimicrobia bacterium]|nr:T9SS type A sorting domain-containing protein [Candidatus Neomarinimicrobiota bacterium]